MAQPNVMRFYLHKALRKRAMEGQHNFLNAMARVCENAGFRVEYRDNSLTERLKSAARSGYAVFLMDDPFHERAVTVRKAYQYPFWAIERSSKRWEWRVAQTTFEPEQTDAAKARTFYGYWQKRLFGEIAQTATRGDFIYVPLQGRLLQHRSFQMCSPVDMLGHVLRHHQNRKVVATLHPKETYTSAETDALNALAKSNPNLRVENGLMERWLHGCDHVVTQNSSAAFAGFFFGKPAVLFGQIDFHHIAANVHDLGVDPALALGPTLTPDYAAYLHWFWQDMSINAGRPDVDQQIKTALLQANWPV